MEQLNNYQDEGEMICPVCEKQFYVMYKQQYAYITKLSYSPKQYYCSYSCMRKAQKEFYSNRKYRTRNFIG